MRCEPGVLVLAVILAVIPTPTEVGWSPSGFGGPELYFHMYIYIYYTYSYMYIYICVYDNIIYIYTDIDI